MLPASPVVISRSMFTARTGGYSGVRSSAKSQAWGMLGSAFPGGESSLLGWSRLLALACGLGSVTSYHHRIDLELFPALGLRLSQLEGTVHGAPPPLPPICSGSQTLLLSPDLLLCWQTAPSTAAPRMGLPGIVPLPQTLASACDSDPGVTGLCDIGTLGLQGCVSHPSLANCEVPLVNVSSHC